METNDLPSGFRSQATQILVISRSCFAEDWNAHAKLLFWSLDILFYKVLVTVVVVDDPYIAIKKSSTRKYSVLGALNKLDLANENKEFFRRLCKHFSRPLSLRCKAIRPLQPCILIAKLPGKWIRIEQSSELRGCRSPPSFEIFISHFVTSENITSRNMYQSMRLECHSKVKLFVYVVSRYYSCGWPREVRFRG